MGFMLDEIVPWGRCYDEYVAMFDLNDVDLERRILGCGDGPAGFNAGLTERGGHVVSIDPLYRFNVGQIRCRIAETFDRVMTKLRANESDYLWHTIPSPDDLGRIRLAAMDAFLSDFDSGRRAGRYVAGALPSLPLADDSFDIALSSHFLFLYSVHMSAQFHLQAIREMLRVAREVRLFPLLTLDGKPSPHVDFVAGELAGQGLDVVRKHVAYEFQRGANEMLVVRRTASDLRRAGASSPCAS
jgi:hypothetical protein